MATYAHGYKKRNSEMLLLKVIVGLIGVVLLIVGVAYLYQTIVDVGDYTDWTAVDKYADVLALEDADGNALSDYAVYFYSDSCTHCAEIKEDALRLVKRINADGDVIFFVNTANITASDDYSKDDLLVAIGQSSLLTPMLVVVSNGAFQEAVTGSAAVLDLLTQIRTGDYVPFQ